MHKRATQRSEQFLGELWDSAKPHQQRGGDFTDLREYSITGFLVILTIHIPIPSVQDSGQCLPVILACDN